MELLFVILAIIVFCFVMLNRPSRWNESNKKLEDVAEILERPDTIEDSTILKQQLANAQAELNRAYEEARIAHEQLGRTKYEVAGMENENVKLMNSMIALQSAYDKLQHQKKSSEVRTGTFVEILAPIAEQFPVDPKTMRFLGAPIDYISFDYETDMITFVEVKSGQSQLNENQRRVKKMVENGRVKFAVVRLDENGIKVK
jgi:predicted Holliday junction resolvase-like endonuclease